MTNKSILKEINSEKDILPSFPLDLEGKNLLIYLLAIMAGIDGDINNKEKKLLEKTIEKLGLPISENLENCLEIAKADDKLILSEIIEFFKQSDLKYDLLLLLINMAISDADLNENEGKLLNYIHSELGMPEQERDSFTKLAQALQENNTEKIFYILYEEENLYDRIKPTLLLYGIDLDKFHRELKLILDFETFDINVNLSLTCDKETYLIKHTEIKFEESELTFKISKSYITNLQFYSYLKYLTIKSTDLIKFEKDILFLNNRSIISIPMSDFNLSKNEDGGITIEITTDKADSPITGVFPNGILEFSKFVTTVTTSETRPLKFISNNDADAMFRIAKKFVLDSIWSEGLHYDFFELKLVLKSCPDNHNSFKDIMFDENMAAYEVDRLHQVENCLKQFTSPGKDLSFHLMKKVK